MKNSVRNFVKIALTSTIALAIVAVLSLPLRSSATEQTKGAQKMISAPVITQAGVAPVVGMSCSLCKDKLVTSTTAAGKGAFTKTTTVHTCASGSVASCCGAN